MEKCPECGSNNVSDYSELINELTEKKTSIYTKYIIISFIIAWLVSLPASIILVKFFNIWNKDNTMKGIFFIVFISCIFYLVAKYKRKVEIMKKKKFCKDCMASWQVKITEKKPRRKSNNII